MATQKKETKTTNTKTKTEDTSVTIDKEKEELKQKIEELQKAIEVLTKANQDKDKKESTPVKSKKGIKIINLTRGEMYLRGSRIHKFDKQFDSRVFTEGEVRQIYINMPQTLAEGYVYIADNDMVEELELTDAYSSLIDANTLKILLNKNADDIIEIYKNANDIQKATIIGMIEDKKLAGNKIDANVLISLGKLCGKNLLEIEPLTE